MNIDKIVDEILNEETVTDKYTLFAVISETKGFANSAKFIRNYDCKNKVVFFCETMEKLLPKTLAKEMLGDVKIIDSKYFSFEPEKIKEAEKIIIPVFPINLASALANLSGDGVVSNALCSAITYKIPIIASITELENCVKENPNLKEKVEKIKNSLIEMGVSFFKIKDDISNNIKFNEVTPDLEIVEELIEHFTGVCELEEDKNCVNCTKCKVRGF